MKKRKIVLIGAGSAVFTKGLIADFIKADGIGSWEIALVDIDERVLSAIVNLAKKMVKQKGADHITISGYSDRRNALSEADVVTTTIAVGGRRAWEQDVFIPRKYGIYQPVGDSILPGGISRAMRMIPEMIAIAEDVKRFCPEAYFFNYSNPMTAVTAAVRKATGVELIGLCHGVIYGVKYLARMLQVDYRDLSVIGTGVNHLTFLYHFFVKGEDAKPAIHEVLRRQRLEAEKNGHSYNFMNPELEDRDIPHFMDNPFSWEIFERYGALPAVLDRHAVEFYPERFADGSYVPDYRLGVEAFPFEKIVERGDANFKRMIEQGEGDSSVEEDLFSRAEGEHEELVQILKSLFNDEGFLFYANVPNHGAVPNLPYDAVIEAPVVARASGFHTLSLHDFPDVLAAKIKQRYASTECTVEAALAGDKKLFQEALILDGSISNWTDAEKIGNDLLKAHKNNLPRFFGEAK